jgi:RNA polymerase sigma-70 factor (ECF subfamily)
MAFTTIFQAPFQGITKKIVTVQGVVRYIDMMETYSSFYRAHKDKLFGYLIRLSGDYQLACDIMQESFTRFLEHYAGKPLNPSLLYTIARNAVFDDVRKRTQTKDYRELIDDQPPDLEKQLLIREDYRNVLAAMQQLEKTERDILALTVSSDMTYREIGAVTGISEANVKVKVHRARIRLKKILKMEKNDG